MKAVIAVRNELLKDGYTAESVESFLEKNAVGMVVVGNKNSKVNWLTDFGKSMVQNTAEDFSKLPWEIGSRVVKKVADMSALPSDYKFILGMNRAFNVGHYILVGDTIYMDFRDHSGMEMLKAVGIDILSEAGQQAFTTLATGFCLSHATLSISGIALLPAELVMISAVNSGIGTYADIKKGELSN